MPAHTGEKARETGTFHCADCDGKVHVQKGEEIPPCPCGGNTFDRRTDEPGQG